MVAVVQLMRELLPLLLVLAGAATTESTIGYSPEANRSPSTPSDSRRKEVGELYSAEVNHEQEQSPNAVNLRSEASTTPSSVSSSVAFAMSRQPLSSSPTATSLSRSLRIGTTATVLETDASFLDHQYNDSTTSSTNEIGIPRAGIGRGTRDIADNPCSSFTIGNESKQEFYSPNYPDNYPNQTNCIKVLKADKGMLLKLDFRDRFDLEPSEACRFDYLEVRDGEHGYSNLIGQFCGKQFPPEITSVSRFLWLRFRSDESIEYGGFKAVWSMIPRPTDKGVPPESEPCIKTLSGPQAIVNSTDFAERKKQAVKYGVALDCMWVIKVNVEQKVQLHFTEFKLQKPNECDANFVDVFDGRTEMPHRLRNFCGSIADLVSSTNNTVYIRYYVEPRAMNSSVLCTVTAFRERPANEKNCRVGEYDCEDARCINETLKCNKEPNCRFRWDEDKEMCGRAGLE